MLPVSLNCPFLIAPSVFSNVCLHKCPYKYRFIARSAKCSTKPLFKLSTSILSAVRPGVRVTVKLNTQAERWCESDVDFDKLERYGIIRPVVSASALTWFIRYIFNEI